MLKLTLTLIITATYCEKEPKVTGNEPEALHQGVNHVTKSLDHHDMIWEVGTTRGTVKRLDLEVKLRNLVY